MGNQIEQQSHTKVELQSTYAEGFIKASFTKFCFCITNPYRTTVTAYVTNSSDVWMSGPVRANNDLITKDEFNMSSIFCNQYFVKYRE